MKKLIQLGTAVLLSISAMACSCNKPEEETTLTPDSNNNNTRQGKGTVTLLCNGQTFVTAGNCNYSSTAEAVVIADSNNNANAVTLNIEGGLPTGTKTYKLVDVVSGTESLSMSFTRFPSSGTMYNWEAKDGAGTMTMTVDGNKINCTFSNIPMDGSNMHNPADLAGGATCWGSFILYK